MICVYPAYKYIYCIYDSFEYTCIICTANEKYVTSSK